MMHLNKQKLQNLIDNNKNFAALDRDTAMVINVCANSKLKIDPDEEVVDMCKAIAEMRTEAIIEGVQEGALAKAKETVLNLYEMGMKPEVIAKTVNVNVELVRGWIKSVS